MVKYGTSCLIASIGQCLRSKNHSQHGESLSKMKDSNESSPFRLRIDTPSRRHILDIHPNNTVRSISKSLHLWIAFLVVTEGLPQAAEQEKKEDKLLIMKTATAGIIDQLLAATGCESIRDLSSKILTTLKSKNSTGQ